MSYNKSYNYHNSDLYDIYTQHIHIRTEMDPRVKLGHMDCLVQTAPTTTATTTSDVVGDGLGGFRSDEGSGGVLGGDGDKMTEEVTFLYRLCDGSSPKSHGINVRIVLLSHTLYVLYTTCNTHNTLYNIHNSHVLHKTHTILHIRYNIIHRLLVWLVCPRR